MHVLTNNPAFDTLQLAEKVFVEAWFNLTHPESIDTFRVRCHNGKTILEELKRELENDIANAQDLGVIAEEALSLLGADICLQGRLGGTLSTLEEGLKAIKMLAEAKEKDEPKIARMRAQIGHYLTDILPSLPQVYLEHLLSSVEDALSRSDVTAVLRTAEFLASELAARGWAVGSLHSWVS